MYINIGPISLSCSAPPSRRSSEGGTPFRGGGLDDMGLTVKVFMLIFERDHNYGYKE